MKINNKNLDDVLLDFRHSMNSMLQNEAKESGYSLSQFEIIRYVADKESVTMKEIASWLHITPPSASALIDILVSKKLVKRIQKASDRRTIHISLGEKAHEFFYSIHKKKIQMFKKMLSKLDQKDKEDLTRILIKCMPN